jgi:hypothetical protein
MKPQSSRPFHLTRLALQWSFTLVSLGHDYFIPFIVVIPDFSTNGTQCLSGLGPMRMRILQCPPSRLISTSPLYHLHNLTKQTLYLSRQKRLASRTGRQSNQMARVLLECEMARPTATLLTNAECLPSLAKSRLAQHVENRRSSV